VPQLDALTSLARALAQPAHPSSDFDLNTGFVLPDGRKLRPAAVLIAFQANASGLGIVLTKRASHLRHHAGQIAFPGGKMDEGDLSLTHAALREAQEEIGLPPSNVQILGELPAHETVTAYQVTPILGLITAPFTPIPEVGEVAEVFSVPLTHLSNLANYRVESRMWQGRQRNFYTVPYGPYYIWGATARILRGLADRMQA
jgi:8-oxo-dGTP pyrophosphatase MutT (NUDIX family)